MSFIVVIEPDPKTVKDITEAYAELSKTFGYKVLIFSDLAAFKTEWLQPEFKEKIVSLLVVNLESVLPNTVENITALRHLYQCDVLITLFDDPKNSKNSDTWPVQNLLYKPFDLTILKEHTRFALLKSQKVQTQYVHTTKAKAEIESLKKLKALQLTETGFKIGKIQPLLVGHVYKFYNPLFTNNKHLHIWGRVVSENESAYELIFCQLNPVILSSIRKKIVGATSKVKNAAWTGRNQTNTTQVLACVQITEEGQNAVVVDLLQRNFDAITFVDKKDLKGRAKVDLLITDTNFEERQLENQFEPDMTYIRLMPNKPIKRIDLEDRFRHETIRLEKPLDKAILVKMVKQLFPLLKEKEPQHNLTITFEEPLMLSTLIEVEEYSEAAVAFKQSSPIPTGTMLDITLSQDDESLLKEMKAKVHYVDEKANGSGTYHHQMILYGMKDEFLKLIRLWTLQRHIQTNQGN